MIKLDHGQFRMSNMNTGPVDANRPWQPIQLPDVWNNSRPDVGGTGIYRFELPLNVAPNRLWALLLPRVSTNVEVYLNGELLGRHGEFTDYSTIWNHPFSVTIPNGLLQPGKNIIDVKVAAPANSFGRLNPVFIGPDTDIKPYYQKLYTGQITLSMICGVFALTMGLSLLMVWWYRRDSLYGWFALGALSWSLYSLYFFLIAIPVAISVWIAFCFGSGFIMLGSMLIFICQFMNWKNPFRDKLIIGYSLFAALLGFLLPDGQVFNGIIWNLGVFAILYVVLGIVLINALRFERSKRQALTSLIGIGLNIGLGIHDWANIFFTLNHSYLLQYGQPLIFIVMGRKLLKDYIYALKVSQQTNAELDQRVKVREQELQVSMQRTKVAEHEKLLLKERERIMADIHDGVGGHLISALAIAEHTHANDGGLVSQTIHQALDELRIVIDSLDPDDRKLSQMLASFRYRYDKGMQSHGIKISWKFDGLDHLDLVGPEKSLQVLRILQELLTNIIKHARASETMIWIGISEGGEQKECWLSVTDNGIGFDMEKRQGRGLGNLRRRTEAVGGNIEFITSLGAGTLVELTFPFVIMDLEPVKVRD